MGLYPLVPSRSDLNNEEGEADVKEKILALKENHEDRKQMLLTAIPVIVLAVLIVFLKLLARAG